MKFWRLSQREKTLLLVLVVVSIGCFLIDLYAQKKGQKLGQFLVQLQEEILKIEERSMVKGMIPEPGNGVSTSFHDPVYEDGVWRKNHEDGLIKKINPAENVIEVDSMDSKKRITFRTSSEHLKQFHVGWIAPITFNCAVKVNENCNLAQPFNLFISNQEVELISVIERSP